ncbi:hypothetical protein KQX54_014950 [Cotesia glomerata]|uniref:Uncharacterized protein n=1 Tax=Cotesia glomerata TaxID=32391 RepID=A0AAV7IV36_COTGL|nr:hypothetical protein KQX54_014950 [Cotesia glomerata]
MRYIPKSLELKHCQIKKTNAICRVMILHEDRDSGLRSDDKGSPNVVLKLGISQGGNVSAICSPWDDRKLRGKGKLETGTELGAVFSFRYMLTPRMLEEIAVETVAFCIYCVSRVLSWEQKHRNIEIRDLLF